VILVQCLPLVDAAKNQLGHVELDETDNKLNTYQNERDQTKPSMDGREVRMVALVHFCCHQSGSHRLRARQFCVMDERKEAPTDYNNTGHERSHPSKVEPTMDIGAISLLLL
jgi:hypothetical protein